MKSLSLEEEYKIEDIRILFRLKKRELNYTAVKDITNPFRQKRETKAIKYTILGDIKNLLSMNKKKKISINQ